MSNVIQFKTKKELVYEELARQGEELEKDGYFTITKISEEESAACIAAMDKEAQAEIERYFRNKKRAELNQESTDSD